MIQFRILLGGLCALLLGACFGSPTQPSTATSSGSNSSASQVKDTLPGLLNTGLDVRESAVLESTSVISLQAFGKNLAAVTAHHELYALEGGKWVHLQLPNGDQPAASHALAAHNSSSVYILGRQSLWSYSGGGVWVQVPVPKTETWCLKDFMDQCRYESLHFDGRQLLLTGVMGYVGVEWRGAKNPYMYISKDQGQTWDTMPGFPDRVPYNDRIRNLSWDGNNLYAATWENGLWWYNGTKWDSVPKIAAKNTDGSYDISTTGDTTRIIKYGGVASLGGKLYAAEYTGELWEFTTGGKFTNIIPAYTRNTGYNYGIDTVCGALLSHNYSTYWKPGMSKWDWIIESIGEYYGPTDSVIAFANTDIRPIRMGAFLGYARIGDTLFMAYQGGGTDNDPNRHKGGVAAFDLRQARWCTEAWERGKPWRDSIFAAQKARLMKK